MKAKIKIGEKTYNVEISEIEKDLIKVIIDNEEFIFSENEYGQLELLERKGYQNLKKPEEAFCPLFKEKEIRSPIAGMVSEILVKEGEEIKVGQKVLNLISMKMENEIISESCGKIKKIKVKKDQFVNSGDVLIILE